VLFCPATTPKKNGTRARGRQVAIDRTGTFHAAVGGLNRVEADRQAASIGNERAKISPSSISVANGGSELLVQVFRQFGSARAPWRGADSLFGKCVEIDFVRGG
jgi:hypothetical protein